MMKKDIFPLQITKRIYIISILVTVVPIFLVTGLVQVSYYKNEMTRMELNLFKIVEFLDKELNGSFEDILRRHNGLDKSKSEQALIINKKLQREVEHMSEVFPGYGMGYYSLELGRRVAIGPNFSVDKLAAIPNESPYLDVYKAGKPVLRKVYSTLIWKDEPLLSLSAPIYRNQKLIGHVFASARLNELYTGILQKSILILLAGCLVALLVCRMGWWLLQKLNNELELFSKAVVQGDSGEVTEILPELNPIIEFVKERTEKLETTVKQLEEEIYRRKTVEEELLRDITEREKAEEKIAFQASILEQVRNAVIVTDLDGTVVYWNNFAQTIYGWKVEEIVNKNISELIVKPESSSLANRKIREAILRKGYWEGEVEIASREGKSLPVHRVATSIRNANGIPTGIISVGIDLTERKKLEKEIARLDRLHMIGEMAAGIGHEVRNPMTTVRGFMQLLALKEDNLIKQEQFNLMIEELDRANAIITEYLSLAKNKKVELKPGNLNTVLNNLRPLLIADAMVSDKYIVTELRTIPKILMDEKEITQLILNLVRNGLEAMASGGTVTIKTYPEGDDVVVMVQDTGAGVDPGILDRLGTPFVTTKDSGTGLGLAISYSIVQRHNGTIIVDTGDAGTIFYIRFPECLKVFDEPLYCNAG